MGGAQNRGAANLGISGSHSREGIKLELNLNVIEMSFRLDMYDATSFM